MGGQTLCALLLLCAPVATASPIFGGKRTKEAAAGWLEVWRSAYQTNDGSVPELKDAEVPEALQGMKSMIVISSGGAAGGVVTEGMGYAIMVEGIHALGGSKDAQKNGLALTKGWLGMVYGPPEMSMGKVEVPLGGGSGEKGSATQVDVPPYGVSAIEGKAGGYSGMAAWKFPVNQCAPFCHGTATDGDEDALLGMIYLAEALGAPDDFVDMVMRAAISFASTDLGFPDLFRTLPDGSRMFVPKGGSDWGGLVPDSGKYGASQQPWCYNPSYFAPGHYRVFRDFIQKYWTSSFDDYLPPYLDSKPSTMKDLVASLEGAITAGYNILYHSSCSSGAVSNWVGVKAECKGGDLNCEGVPWATTPYVGAKGTCTASGTLFGSYGPDASRTPWRIAMDYILYEEESTKVNMYDRNGKSDSSLEFNAQVYLNRFVDQYTHYATCDGGKAGSCVEQGAVATFELASAFSMNAPGLTCKNVPNPGQDWWAGFMSYPTFTVFVAPHGNLTTRQSAQWQETLAGICDFSGKAPEGGLCSDTYFELGQEVISTMVMSGIVVPLYSAGGGPPPSTASTTEFVPAPTAAGTAAPAQGAVSAVTPAPVHGEKTVPSTSGLLVTTTAARPAPIQAPTLAEASTTSGPAASLVGGYDCTTGLSHWQKGWSLDKKEFCCESAQVGCEDDAGAPALAPETPTLAPETPTPAPETPTAAPKAAAPAPAKVGSDSNTKGTCCLVGSSDGCKSCDMLAEAPPNGQCGKSEAACLACGPRAGWCGADGSSSSARSSSSKATAATPTPAPATPTPAPDTSTPAPATPTPGPATPSPSPATPSPSPATPTPAPLDLTPMPPAAAAPTPRVAPAKDASANEAEAVAKSRTPQTSKVGRCCLAGSDVDDFCGSCYDVAWADPGSSCSESEDGCSACGSQATWCPGGSAPSAVEDASGGVKQAKTVTNIFDDLIRKYDGPQMASSADGLSTAAAGCAALALAAALTASVAYRRRSSALASRSTPTYGPVQVPAGGAVAASVHVAMDSEASEADAIA